jgi:hypothetical protein
LASRTFGAGTQHTTPAQGSRVPWLWSGVSARVCVWVSHSTAQCAQLKRIPAERDNEAQELTSPYLVLAFILILIQQACYLSLSLWEELISFQLEMVFQNLSLSIFDYTNLPLFW